jgi:ribonuclease VapC
MNRSGAHSLRPSSLLAAANVEIIAVDLPQVHAAREAFRQFGKGRHPAGLNFGDCFSYALAKGRSEPLLFKGSDFSQTDILLP